MLNSLYMKTFECGTKNKKIKECENNFIRNGSLLQEELIAFCKGKNLPIHVFSAKEVIKMSNFTHLELLQWHAHHQIYRGKIGDSNRDVCIKKYYRTHSFVGVQGIVRGIVIATQISMHINSLKLLGCCLETEFPAIVYELPHQGCLGDLICRREGLLSWKLRLRIASEISYALAYLQNCFARPVIFRNLHSRDVFLDKDYVAKLSGFYFSVLIPEGEDQVNDAVVGSTGYGAPEYIRSGRLTEKTDVFCFGVLLIELLVGQCKHNRGYHFQFLTKIRDYRQNIEIDMIVDPGISREIKENGRQQLKQVFELALNCTADNEDDRPSMIDVASELKKILASN